jgi:hypothetical protein
MDNVQLHIKHEKNGVYGGNAKITTMSEIYQASVSVYFVSGSHNYLTTEVKICHVKEMHLHGLVMNYTVYIVCCQLKKGGGQVFLINFDLIDSLC